MRYKFITGSRTAPVSVLTSGAVQTRHELADTKEQSPLFSCLHVGVLPFTNSHSFIPYMNLLSISLIFYSLCFNTCKYKCVSY